MEVAITLFIVGVVILVAHRRAKPRNKKTKGTQYIKHTVWITANYPHPSKNPMSEILEFIETIRIVPVLEEYSKLVKKYTKEPETSYINVHIGFRIKDINALFEAPPPKEEEKKPKKKVPSHLKERKIESSNLQPDLEGKDPNHPLFNKRIVFTGLFDNMPRNDMAQIAQMAGANVNTSISRKTDYIIIGEDPGPKKLEKIDELISQGYPLKKINELQFLQMFDNGEVY